MEVLWIFVMAILASIILAVLDAREWDRKIWHNTPKGED